MMQLFGRATEHKCIEHVFMRAHWQGNVDTLAKSSLRMRAIKTYKVCLVLCVSCYVSRCVCARVLLGFALRVSCVLSVLCCAFARILVLFTYRRLHFWCVTDIVVLLYLD